jgi:hypothetical protein
MSKGYPLGSAGCQPAAFGSLAECSFAQSANLAVTRETFPQDQEGSRQAAANGRLAACAPQRERTP